jgi:dTMP kinase
LSLFITLEGPDGAGKSTQAIQLAEHLRAAGYQVLLTREPGGTAIGSQIRSVLMSLDNTSMDPRSEILLFSASRAQLVREVIRPNLEQGTIVICDRYFHSTLAYQGYGHGLDLAVLATITEFATGGLQPDLILLVDLPVEAGLKRRMEGGDWNRLDAYDLEFHQRVRDGYLHMADADPKRWEIVDGNLSVPDLQKRIREIIQHRLDSPSGHDNHPA